MIYSTADGVWDKETLEIINVDKYKVIDGRMDRLSFFFFFSLFPFSLALEILMSFEDTERVRNGKKLLQDATPRSIAMISANYHMRDLY